MTGRCIPAEPHFLPVRKFRAEKQVWQAVRRHLRDTDVLLHGVRFVANDGDWEADLVVLLPEGFCVIEVKGGHVRFADGEYWQQTPDGPKSIDLTEQALSEKYLLRRYLANHPAWQFGHVRMAHLVALPDMQLAADADFGPGLPRTHIIDGTQLADAVGIAFDRVTTAVHNEPMRVPGVAGVELAAEILGGTRDPVRELAELRSARAEHVAALGEELHVLLDAVADWPRIEFVGGPGTGKTTLALEQTRRWAAAGLRVGYVAFSRGLITWVRRQINDWPPEVAGRVVPTTFHGLGQAWGVGPVDVNDPDEWESTMPARMMQAARTLRPAERFDALVVDESQDFAESWWPVLLASQAAAGRIAVFGDPGQAIFRAPAGVDLGQRPLQLRANLRNAQPIGSLVNAARHTAGLELRGGSGPRVRFVATTPEETIHGADTEVDALLEAGWPPNEIALLTTGHRHLMQLEVVEHHGRDGYWDTLWDGGQVFHSTVAGFKGLERPAVVLAVDGFRDERIAREVLVVGMSRARDLLVVVGDPELIRSVGGKELVRRLRSA